MAGRRKPSSHETWDMGGYWAAGQQPKSPRTFPTQYKKGTGKSERGVKYNQGPVFRADRKGTNRLRLTYSQNTSEEIEKGIAILADVFEKEGFFNT